MDGWKKITGRTWTYDWVLIQDKYIDGICVPMEISRRAMIAPGGYYQQPHGNVVKLLSDDKKPLTALHHGSNS